MRGRVLETATQMSSDSALQHIVFAQFMRKNKIFSSLLTEINVFLLLFGENAQLQVSFHSYIA